MPEAGSRKERQMGNVGQMKAGCHLAATGFGDREDRDG